MPCLFCEDQVPILLEFIDLETDEYLTNIVRAINHHIGNKTIIDLEIIQISNKFHMSEIDKLNLLKFRQFITDELSKRSEKALEKKKEWVKHAFEIAVELFRQSQLDSSSRLQTMD